MINTTSENIVTQEIVAINNIRTDQLNNAAARFYSNTMSVIKLR